MHFALCVHLLCVLPTGYSVTLGFRRAENLEIVASFVRFIPKEMNLFEITVLLHVLQAVGFVPPNRKNIEANLQPRTRTIVSTPYNDGLHLQMQLHKPDHRLRTSSQGRQTLSPWQQPLLSEWQHLCQTLRKRYAPRPNNYGQWARYSACHCETR